MKKTLAGAMLAVLALIFSQASPQPAAAQVDTTTMSVQAQLELIQTLLAQVMELQKMLLAMQGGAKPAVTLPAKSAAPVDYLADKVLLDDIQAIERRNGAIEVVVTGKNLKLVEEVKLRSTQNDDRSSQTAKFELRTVGNGARLVIRVPETLLMNTSDNFLLSVELLNKAGKRLSLTPVEIKRQPVSTTVPATPKALVKAELINRVGDSASVQNPLSRVDFVFTVEDYRPGLVMDVEIAVDCDALIGGQTRDCRQYRFDLEAKAAESYTGVLADPFVRGGASYRFTNMGGRDETITIKGYVSPGYNWSTRNEHVPYPNSIEYRFILRDTINGTEVWNKSYNIINFKS